MATACAGVTARWNFIPFAEVVDIKVSLGGGFPIARASTWAFDAGTIDIQCLANTHAMQLEIGKKNWLAIQGEGFAFVSKAVVQRVDWTGKLNDIERYTVSFKITPG